MSAKFNARESALGQYPDALSRAREEGRRELAAEIVADLVRHGAEAAERAKAEGRMGQRERANQYWAVGGTVDSIKRFVERLAAQPPAVKP